MTEKDMLCEFRLASLLKVGRPTVAAFIGRHPSSLKLRRAAQWPRLRVGMQAPALIVPGCWSLVSGQKQEASGEILIYENTFRRAKWKLVK